MRLLVLLAIVSACGHTLDGAQNPPLAKVWPVASGNLAASVYTLVAPDGTPALATVADDRGLTLVTAESWCDLLGDRAAPIMAGSTVTVHRVASLGGACLLAQTHDAHELGLGVVWYDPGENPAIRGRATVYHGQEALLVGAPVYAPDGVRGIVADMGTLRIAPTWAVLSLLDRQGLHAQSLHTSELDYDPESEHEGRQTGQWQLEDQ